MLQFSAQAGVIPKEATQVEGSIAKKIRLNVGQSVKDVSQFYYQGNWTIMDVGSI